VYTWETHLMNSAMAPRGTKRRDFLRQLRLQLLNYFIQPLGWWNSTSEQRKVAMYQNRSMALLLSLLHAPPLTGAIMLLYAYYTEFWVGFRFDATVYFQFLAKLQELLMQASIIHINMSIIRMMAVDSYVPLGILSGATQSAQLSYLWSLDFWSALRAKDSCRPYRTRVLFTVCFPVLLLLTALVGPSAAVLIIPRFKTPVLFRSKTLFAFGGMDEPTQKLFPSYASEVSNATNGLVL
jgi:hypothetical protein